jgi:hypothetical protein
LNSPKVANPNSGKYLYLTEVVSTSPAHGTVIFEAAETRDSGSNVYTLLDWFNSLTPLLIETWTQLQKFQLQHKMLLQ